MGLGINECPNVCILTIGPFIEVSPKSHRYSPLQTLGHARGSTPIISIFGWIPSSFSLAKGIIKPAKFEPPPIHPITISGFSISTFAS